MKEENKYSIQFSGLAEGKHHFTFQVSKDFLENYGETEVNDLKINIDALMEKTSRYLSFEFHIEGVVNVQCDRCLDYFDLELSFDNQLYVIFGEETSDLTDIDDRMVLSRKEDEIDLSKHFYDYINLQIPIKKIHQEDENGDSTCSSEMLDNIKRYMGGAGSSDNVDPRWDKLKNLYN